jgi:hypothetical protein
MAATASIAKALGMACSAAPGCVLVDNGGVVAVPVLPMLVGAGVDVNVDVAGLVAVPVPRSVELEDPELELELELLPLDLVEIENWGP